MITITPYLSFLDQGQEALKFYEQAIEAKVISMRTFGELPGQEIPDEAKDRIMHAHLKVGETDLMISDSFPNQPAPQSGDQITLALVINGAEKAEEVFNRLQDGGEVVLPLQETFFSPAYGQVKDKFGVLWQISAQPQ